MGSRRQTAGRRWLRGCGPCLMAILVIAMSVVIGPLGETVEATAAVSVAGGGPVAQGWAGTPRIQVNCSHSTGGGHFPGAHCMVILARAQPPSRSAGETGFLQAPEVTRKASGDRPPHPPPRGSFPI